MTKQIHLPAPVEPALKPPLALLGGWGGGVKCEEKRQRMREDPRKISAVPYFPTSGRPATNPLQHTHTNPPTGKGAEQEGWEKRERTLPDSQTSTFFFLLLLLLLLFLFWVSDDSKTSLSPSIHLLIINTRVFKVYYLHPTPITAEKADRLREGKVSMQVKEQLN